MSMLTTSNESLPMPISYDGAHSFVREHRRVWWAHLVLLVIFAAVSLKYTAAKADESTALFQFDRILEVDIQMDQEEWLELRTTHRESGEDFSKITEDPYKYYNSQVKVDGTLLPKIGIRKKGFFGSVVSTRPSLKLRFDRFDENQKLATLGMMTLNNNVQDYSQVHQLLAYRFFNRAGLFSPRAGLAHVRVNGEDLGIYTHVESIRKQFIKRHFSSAKGYLYEGYVGDFNENEFARIVIKSDKKTAARKKLEQLKETILQSERINISDLEGILNLPAFIQFWAAEVLIGHWDGYAGNRNNYYLYFDKKSDLFHFIPWGADAVFSDPGPFIQQATPKSVKAMSVICRRLWEMPEIRVRYRKELRRLLEEVWDEAQMKADIEEIQENIVSSSKTDLSNMEQATGVIFEFLKTRRSDILKELNEAPVDWPEVKMMVPDMENFVPMQMNGSFTTVFSDSHSGPLANTGEATLDVRIAGKAQEPFTTFGANAVTKNQGFMVPRPDYPMITLTASNDAGDKTWHLSFLIDPIRLTGERQVLPADHFATWVQLVEGDPMSPTAKRIPFGIMGSLTIEPTKLAIGEKVSGTFELMCAAFEQVKSD